MASAPQTSRPRPPPGSNRARRTQRPQINLPTNRTQQSPLIAAEPACDTATALVRPADTVSAWSARNAPTRVKFSCSKRFLQRKKNNRDQNSKGCGFSKPGSGFTAALKARRPVTMPYLSHKPRNASIATPLTATSRPPSFNWRKGSEALPRPHRRQNHIVGRARRWPPPSGPVTTVTLS